MERDTESPIDVVGINEAAALPFNLVSFHLKYFHQQISYFVWILDFKNLKLRWAKCHIHFNSIHSFHQIVFSRKTESTNSTCTKRQLRDDMVLRN